MQRLLLLGNQGVLVLLNEIKQFLESKGNLVDVPRASDHHLATAEGTDHHLFKGNLFVIGNKAPPVPLQCREQLRLIVDENVAEDPRIVEPPVNLVGLLAQLVQAQFASRGLQVIGRSDIANVDRVPMLLEVTVLDSLHEKVVHLGNHHIHLLLILHRKQGELTAPKNGDSGWIGLFEEKSHPAIANFLFHFLSNHKTLRNRLKNMLQVKGGNLLFVLGIAH